MVTEVIYFLNELDLLEAHLHEHKNFGWQTIIVEAPVTISGIEKPLFYYENKNRYAGYDLEHIVLPKELFPLIHGEDQYRQFRKNDWAKRLWIQENLNPNTPWIFHSDADEILDFSKFEDWGHILDDINLQYICFMLDERIGRIDLHGKTHAAYRLARKELSLEQLGNPKSVKRIGINSAGWHFHNCRKSAEEAQ